MKLVRSNRRTLSLEIKAGEGVIVRAPLHASKEEINNFINSHKDWIEKHLKKMQERKSALASVNKLSMEEIKALAEKALFVIPERVKYYAEKLNVSYGRITIRNQKTRWGSCSKRKNLNFNCLLMLTPPDVMDSVIIHELCHLKEMNHSERFYAEVLSVFPDYWRCHRWLKENGAEIMARLP